MFITKEKTIYENLNKLRLQQNLYYGLCWCPLAKENEIIDTLNDIARGKPHMASAQLQPTQQPKNKSPPTYIQTNDFTGPFQEIVNTYGIPRYREVNPGFFTVVTFPFLFGVMFGDIGHASILVMLGN